MSTTATIETDPNPIQSRPWMVIAVWFVITRLLLMISSGVAIRFFKLQPGRPPPSDLPPWLAVWCRWDTLWYLDIAQNGYSFEPGIRSNVVFPPLYPLLMRGGGLLLGHNPYGWILSGFLISNVLLLAAMFYLHRLIRLDFDDRVARCAVVAYLACPYTFFLSAVYPMSLILLIAVASFYYARVGRWWLTGIIASLACLARPEGMLLGASLLIEYLAQRRFQLRRVGWDLLALGFPLLTLAGWMVYLRMTFGDGFIFVTNHQYWARQPISLAKEHWEAALGVVSAGVILALAGVSWFKLRASYAFFATSCILLFISTPRWVSLPRMALVIFPTAILIPVLIENKLFWRIVLPLSTLAACGLMIRFVSHHFMG